AIAVEYIDALLAAMPAPADAGAALPAPAELVEPLTEREQEVLRLMAQGLTYQQMAEQLIVSINTVRYYVRNVYSKLDVHRRGAAIARARALGLLPAVAHHSD
ncbi:MAG: helix-turn-helix transcriptional regulator, partial [Caldilinea sp.]|nr:helix-turn-helix transcriptional regulator [Caldilinea sp.]